MKHFLLIATIFLFTFISCSNEDTNFEFEIVQDENINIFDEFASSIPSVYDLHEHLIQHDLNIELAANMVYNNVVTGTVLSHSKYAMIDNSEVNEVMNYIRNSANFSTLEKDIYTDAIKSIENPNKFDYKNWLRKLETEIKVGSSNRAIVERLRIMKQSFHLAMLIDPSSAKDILKDDGESIIKSSLVGGLFGAASGMYKGCTAGFLGFNPGSVAAGCMAGLIGGTIGCMVAGALQGAAVCAIF